MLFMLFMVSPFRHFSDSCPGRIVIGRRGFRLPARGKVLFGQDPVLYPTGPHVDLGERRHGGGQHLAALGGLGLELG